MLQYCGCLKDVFDTGQEQLYFSLCIMCKWVYSYMKCLDSNLKLNWGVDVALSSCTFDFSLVWCYSFSISNLTFIAHFLETLCCLLLVTITKYFDLLNFKNIDERTRVLSLSSLYVVIQVFRPHLARATRILQPPLKSFIFFCCMALLKPRPWRIREARTSALSASSSSRRSYSSISFSHSAMQGMREKKKTHLRLMSNNVRDSVTCLT